MNRYDKMKKYLISAIDISDNEINEDFKNCNPISFNEMVNGKPFFINNSLTYTTKKEQCSGKGFVLDRNIFNQRMLCQNDNFSSNGFPIPTFFEAIQDDSCLDVIYIIRYAMTPSNVDNVNPFKCKISNFCHAT